MAEADAGTWPRRAFGAWLRRVQAFLAEAGKLLVVVAVVMVVVVVVAVVIVAVLAHGVCAHWSALSWSQMRAASMSPRHCHVA